MSESSPLPSNTDETSVFKWKIGRHTPADSLSIYVGVCRISRTVAIKPPLSGRSRERTTAMSGHQAIHELRPDDFERKVDERYEALWVRLQNAGIVQHFDRMGFNQFGGITNRLLEAWVDGGCDLERGEINVSRYWSDADYQHGVRVAICGNSSYGSRKNSCDQWTNRNFRLDLLETAIGPPEGYELVMCGQRVSGLRRLGGVITTPSR